MFNKATDELSDGKSKFRGEGWYSQLCADYEGARYFANVTLEPTRILVPSTVLTLSLA